VAKILGWLAAVLLALGVGTAYRLPREALFERSIAIERPPNEVFRMLNGFVRFRDWAPWTAKDPGAIYTYEGPETGAAATLRFEGSPWKIGSGYHRIVLVVPDRQVMIAHELGPYRGVSRFILTGQAGGTSVDWSLEVDLGMSPIARWRGLAIERDLDRDTRAGLAALKALVEKTPPEPGAILRPDSAGGGTDAP